MVTFAAFLFVPNETVTVPVQAEETKPLTPVEVRVNDILESKSFQREVRLRATARALYEESLSEQANAVMLAEKALATYRMANDLENEWKISHKINE